MLARRGGPGHDQRPRAVDAHRLGELVGTVDVVVDAGRVPLHGAGDVNAVGGRAQPAEPLRVRLVLHGGECQPAEGGSKQPAQQPVSPGAALGEAAVDDAHGNAATRGGLDEVGPDLELHEGDDVGLHRVEKTPDREREVQRVPDDPVPVTEDAVRAGPAGIGGDRHDDLGRRRKGLDEVLNGVDLAHGHRVQENTPAARRSQPLGPPEPPRPVRPDLAGADHPHQPDRRGHDRGD